MTRREHLKTARWHLNRAEDSFRRANEGGVLPALEALKHRVRQLIEAEQDRELVNSINGCGCEVEK